MTTHEDDASKDSAQPEVQKPATWIDTAWKVGENALFVADFLGEVFAEFFGMTQSRYQWAIDAYERQQRWEREEKEKEAYHKRLTLEAMKKSKEEMRKAQAEMNPNDIKLSIPGGDTDDVKEQLEQVQDQPDQEEPYSMPAAPSHDEEQTIEADANAEA